MSADDQVLRAQMRREDLERELQTVEAEISAIRERGRATMDILSPLDSVRLDQLITARDRVQQDLSEARSEERYQRKLAERSRVPESPRPSLTDWKAKRDRQSDASARETPAYDREPDLERDR